MTILDEIVAHKQGEVAAARQALPLPELEAQLPAAPRARDFVGALLRPNAAGPQVIAEIKRRSPSAGALRPDLHPVELAAVYASHGAAALSVLTDERYFGGSLTDLAQVRANNPLPVLRKEFIIDRYQLVEARLAGADAVLLIAEVLSPPALQQLHADARRLCLDVLVEVHAEASLRAVLDVLGAPSRSTTAKADADPARYLLGINNRDLTVQRTERSTTQRLAALLPAGTPFVSESGIHTRADVEAVHQAGACAILVGESLLRADDPGTKLRELLLGQ